MSARCSDVVEIAVRGPVLEARIARPEAGNSCNSAVMAALEEWIEAAADPAVRVLVLTGTGRSFCGGADLAEATGLLGDSARLRAFLDRGRNLVRRLRAAPVPTIAAVNGAAFGGGLELLLACDIAVAASSARLGDGHIGVGQVPGWGSSVLLPQAVGSALARRLLITAESWSAATAARHGLVSEVVEDLDLAATVTALAQNIAARDRETNRRMLRVARSSPLESGWILEWDNLLEHLASQQHPA